MILVEQRGNYKRTETWLGKLKKDIFVRVLDKYGKKGVDALAKATPRDTGKTAASWDYHIEVRNDSVGIVFTNSSVTDRDIPIVILLYFGHATRNGGYVEGRDFIMPALLPIFEKIAEDAWLEVRSL